MWLNPVQVVDLTVTQDANRVTFFFSSKAMISSLARMQSPLHKFQEVWSLPSSSVGEEEVLPRIVTYREVPVTHPVGQEWDRCVGCVQDTWLDLILRLDLGTGGVTGSRIVAMRTQLVRMVFSIQGM